MIGIFSIFLNIQEYPLNYLIFLGLSFGMIGLFMYFKHRSTFFIGEDDILIKRPTGKKITVHYEDIYDMSVAQGMLAKRLDCGSVYMILKKGYGGVTLMGGGVAEKLDDVPKPQTVYDLISSKMSPFSGA